jgi:hypothetical protein
MERHWPEVADVFREYGDTYRSIWGSSSTAEQRRVFRDIAICRTSALGGHKLKCDHCGHEQNSYNSCRNRHCPKCQAASSAKWFDARKEEIIDVPYFHVVFTIPDSIGQLALQNKREIYNILFRAASETLRTIAMDSKHLGATIGFIAILHTWGQSLHHHPHLHCVVPAGGISPDGQHWVACRDGFFLPVRVLSRMFRGKFLAYLEEAFRQKEICFHGRLADLAQPNAWRRWLHGLRSLPWVVYAKPPFGDPRQVIKYLARYTHRVAISNGRLIDIRNGKVSFRWKDYSNGNRQRIMTLDAVEFIRRFLLHVLPKRFVRIRHYGFLANRDRGKHLKQVRQLTNSPADEISSERDVGLHEANNSSLCPSCKKGSLMIVSTTEPILRSIVAWPFDTS